jgi:dihydrofolate reductase
VHRVIVIEFITLDGVVEDPDGSAGTPDGGWAFRHGPETVAGDKFRLGEIMETGTMLLGRRTWELFAGLWPRRTDPFSQRMNRMSKLVATSTDRDLSDWPNSTRLEGDLSDAVRRHAATQDVVVTGSTSLVHALAADDLVDEYRLLVFPSIVGTGARLFASDGPATELRLRDAQPAGAAALLTYERPVPRRP